MTTISRIFDIPYYQQKHHPLPTALVTKQNGSWQRTSTQAYIDKANTISRAFLKLGVCKNDKIAIISSTNRSEWHIVDIGILQVGAQNIPIYPTISATDYAYILNHSEATICFVSDAEILEKINSIKAETKLQEIYAFDPIAGCKHYSELLELGKEPKLQDAVEARKTNVAPSDLATIIYTSGTTGKPKGVMLSHKNIVSNVLNSASRVPIIEEGKKVLSFLPICHIFERTLTYVYQYTGISIYFAESLDTIADNAKEIHPHMMSVVPRLLEKVYDSIIAKAATLSFFKKALFYWAINIGEIWEPYKKNGPWYALKLQIANKLVFSKWRAALGGQLSTMVSGSAALQPRLARIFCAAGMQVMEGYGLTETSPVVAVGMYANKHYKIGAVGKPIDGVQLKIADDGEILVKGDNVMMGYYKDPNKTAAVITNGYFHTGDKGEIDADGFLKITGRKKELFKTSGGKYIIPTLIENQLKQSRFIEQVMVIGEGEKMPAALIQVNFKFLKEWIDKKNLNIDTSQTAIANSPIVQNRIQKEVDACNCHFSKWETIKQFRLTPDIWSIEAGHLTPTLKMKRSIILDKYHDLIEAIYRPTQPSHFLRKKKNKIP